MSKLQYNLVNLRTRPINLDDTTPAWGEIVTTLRNNDKTVHIINLYDKKLSRTAYGFASDFNGIVCAIKMYHTTKKADQEEQLGEFLDMWGSDEAAVRKIVGQYEKLGLI